MKPVNLCTEVGCTREWSVELAIFGYAPMAPKSSTAMNIKVCEPCANDRVRKSNAGIVQR